MAPLLEIDDLHVEFPTRSGLVQAVRGVSLTVDRCETVGIVGESGSGKSVTSQAVFGIVDAPGRVSGGDIRWKGNSLIRGADAQRTLKRIRGKEIAMIFQDPMSSLNPLFTIGAQIGEGLRHHMGFSRSQAHERTLELLDLVGIASPRRRAAQYAHEFSGGMRQRVLIAMALACEPELLIADEPTTALDVTIQAQILDLLKDVRDKLGLAVLLISHDLGVIADFCERVIVMYGGKVLERAPAAALFGAPANPYTLGLLRAMPRFDSVSERLVAIDGSPPDLREPPPGCPFQPRCDRATAECAEAMPSPTAIGPEHQVSCWHAQPSDSKVLAHG